MPAERSDHLIAAGVGADPKARFRALAAGYGLTESALLKPLIDRAIEVPPPAVGEEPLAVHQAARAERLYVRLYRDDRRLLAERAAARGMPSATYLAVLARAHLRHLHPLPEAERRLFAQGVATPPAIGRNLNPLAPHSANGGAGRPAVGGALPQGARAPAACRETGTLPLEEAGAPGRMGRGTRHRPPRLVHKLVFSIPAGTSPHKVLGAVQNLCREEFALKHRYVMALHTDDPHPHVHVILKATSEQGMRLNIRKAHLKEWRAKFAAHLRELGVEANATPRMFRGQEVRSKSMKAHWAARSTVSEGKSQPVRHKMERAPVRAR